MADQGNNRIPEGGENGRKEGEGYVFDFGGGNAPAPAPLGGEKRELPSPPRKKKANPVKIAGCIAGGVAIAALGFFGGYLASYSSLDEEIRSLIWAKDQIQNNYYEEITDEEFYGAVFDGVKLNVVSEGAFVEAARPVTVERVEGNRIVVREMQQA